MRTTFSAEGDLRAIDVLAGLVGLWREGASGALHFSRSGATAGFHLSAGEVTAVWSSESRFETASILLRAGKLEAATLDRLSTPEGGDRALAALQAGILTKREWRWGEKIRAVEVLSDLLTWIEGDYSLDRGAHADAGEFRLTVPRLILELFLRSRDRALVLHYLGGADVPLARAPRFDSEFAAFGLTADAEAVVRLIDGKATAAQIASEGPAEAFAVEKLLAALVTLGLVHPEFVDAEARPAASHRVDEEPGEEATAESAIDAGPETEETAGEEEAEEEPEGEEAAAPYSRLDVAGPTEVEAEGVELREDRERDDGRPGETGWGGAGELAGASELDGGREVGDEPSIAGARMRPGADAEFDAPLEPESYETVRGRGPAAQAPDSDLDAAPHARDDDDFRKPLDLATGIGSLDRPKARRPGPLLALLALLAAGVAIVILYRSQGSAPGPRAIAPTPRPTPTEAPLGETAVLSPMASPAATEASPAATPPQPVETRRVSTTIFPTAPAQRASSPSASVPVAPVAHVPPASTRPLARTAPATPRPVAAAAPTHAPAPTPSREAPAATRQGWLDRAARDKKRAEADRRAHFAIQLELACEVSTLADAWKHDRPAGSLWVQTTPFGGKTCFRVLWGRYPTKEAARRALSSAPAFFSSARNRPVVVGIR